MLQVAAYLSGLEDRGDLAQGMSAVGAAGDVDLEDLGQHLGPGVITVWSIRVVIRAELKPLLDLGANRDLLAVR